METFEVFKTNFLEVLGESRKSSTLNDRELRDKWKMDPEQMLRRKVAPSTKSFFSFCDSDGHCPVCILIRCLKKHIDPYRIILFIIREFNLSKNDLQNFINQN